jgi:hypothetical protein
MEGRRGAGARGEDEVGDRSAENQGGEQRR